MKGLRLPFENPLARLEVPDYLKRRPREWHQDDGESRTLQGLTYAQRQEWFNLRAEHQALLELEKYSHA